MWFYLNSIIRSKSFVHQFFFTHYIFNLHQISGIKLLTNNLYLILFKSIIQLMIWEVIFDSFINSWY